MDQEKKQAIALMRYSAIAPLLNSQIPEGMSRQEYFNSVSQKGLFFPDGKLKHYSPNAIERWFYVYRRQGFDALMPEGRSDAGKSRKLDADLVSRIQYFKTNYPRMTAAAIYRQLRDDGSILNGQVSESTVERYVRVLGIQEPLPVTDLHRYERPHINEVWCGDSCLPNKSIMSIKPTAVYQSWKPVCVNSEMCSINIACHVFIYS